jgi:hypothetical protein
MPAAASLRATAGAVADPAANRFAIAVDGVGGTGASVATFGVIQRLPCSPSSCALGHVIVSQGHRP